MAPLKEIRQTNLQEKVHKKMITKNWLFPFGRYKMMTICWEEDPNIRPEFAELRNKLKRMENQHKVCIVNKTILDERACIVYI